MDSMETELRSELLENSLCRECEFRSGDFLKYFKNQGGLASSEPVREWRLRVSTEPVREWGLHDLMRTARECRFCSLALKVVSLGRAAEDLQSASAVCSMTIEVLGHTHPDGYCDTDTYDYVSRLRFDLKVGGVKQKISYSDGIQLLSPAYSPGLQLLASDPLDRSKDSMLLGRRIDITQIDIPLVKEHWLSFCEANHPACRPGRWFDSAPNLPLRLIDIKRRKVVEAPHNCKYMALSYVWGDVEQVQLKRETMARLREDGGVSVVTSKSIMDAIALVDMLGIEYLWVDALCIIQDDDEDRETQIANMDVVYTCAVLTIVSAAGSDANGGLPGVFPGSRSITQFIESFNGLNLITSQCPFSWAVNESKWESRGWTFQEKILSKRLLIFTRHQIYYHCNESTWFEDTILENNDPSFGVEMVEDEYQQRCYKPSLEQPPVEKYRKLVTGYVSRNLKYEGDVLNAFAGVLNSVSAELGDFHIWGLPKSIFHQAMLWSTINHSPNRRNLCFPSWSWAGWKGGDSAPISQQHWSLDGKIISNWYRVDEHGSHIIIQPFDPGIQLFDSGRREREEHIRNCGLDLSGDAELGKFHHNNHPCFPCLPWLQGEVVMPPISHLIRFWTTSANLLVLPGNPSNDGGDCYVCEVMTLEKKHLGYIHLSKKWHTNRADNFEFIVISRTMYHFPNQTPRVGLVDVLHVMLIEWRNDIAYRVQLPEEPFKEKTWVEACPQWKLITLS